MEVEKVLDELYSYNVFGIKLGLDNIKKICSLIGNPQNNYKVIHIAGTNGKGSTASMIESSLIDAGYSVGKYTSPHILKFNERISLNGVMISDEDVCRYFQLVKSKLEEDSIQTTFFEITTAMMFLYFSDKNCDYVVLETGLGGRYDATNIVDPVLSIITNVSMDHINILGDNLQDIAREKAGIIKRGRPVFFADDKPELIQAVKEKTELYTNVLETFKPHSHFLDSENFNTVVNLDGDSYRVSLYGDFQVNNFLAAYGALKYIGIENKFIKSGVAKVKWPGRFEIAARDPLLILDGAHNFDSARVLKENILHSYKKEDVAVICSLLEDKDINTVMSEIRGFSDSIILTSLKGVHRGLSGADLLSKISLEFDFEVVEDLPQAFQRALSKNKKLVVVCGSFYLVSKFKEVVKFES